jgi:hypothetical protein
MEKRGYDKNLILFITFLILAGVVNLFTRIKNDFIGSIMFSLNFLIFTGLLLFWIRSVIVRLLPSRARLYMVGSAYLMIFYLFIRVYKYRIASTIVMERYLDYLYFIPLLLIPAFFMIVAILIGKKNSTGKREAVIIIFSTILLFICLTNDYHFLVYIPKVPMNEFNMNMETYSYGPFFYISYAWIVIEAVLGMIILLRKTGISNRKGIIRPIIILIIGILVTIIRTICIKYNLGRPYNSAEINVFTMLGILESCIRNRLIPHNENYNEFFSEITLPVTITDNNLNTIWCTKTSMTLSDENKKAATMASVYTDNDTRLSSIKLKAGYAFYMEDESVLHRLQEELKDANEVLSMENEIIEREYALNQEKLSIEERNRLYTNVSQAIYPAQKKISSLLGEAVIGTDDFRRKIEEILLLTAYVKRKANLTMLGFGMDNTLEDEQGTDEIAIEELSSAMKESLYYLRYAGTEASLTVKAQRKTFSSACIHQIYDCFEEVIEQLLRKTSDLWVSLNDEELMIMADVAPEYEFSIDSNAFPLKQIREDEQLILRFQIKESID